MLSLKFLPAHAPGRPGKTILDALANLRLNADIENTGMNVKGEYSSSEDEDEYYDLKKKISDTEDKSSGSSDGDASSLTSGDKSVLWNEVIPQPRKAKIIERKSKAPKQSPLKSEEEKSEREQKNMEVVVNVKNKTPPKQDLKSGQRVELDPKEVVLNRIQEWVTKEAVEVLYSEDSTTSKVQAKPSGYGAKVSAFFSEDAEMEKVWLNSCIFKVNLVDVMLNEISVHLLGTGYCATFSKLSIPRKLSSANVNGVVITQVRLYGITAYLR